MITWTKYPNVNGFYAEVDELRLTAWPNGTWAVWRTGSKGKVVPRASADKFDGYEKDLEAAKQAAEKAAKEMSNA